MFNSYADYDKCLQEESYIDEKVLIPLNGKNVYQIMTQVNDAKNNWRLCQAVGLEGDMGLFTKRIYLPTAKVDKSKYKEYYEKEILPLIQRSNEFLKKDFPEVTTFY